MTSSMRRDTLVLLSRCHPRIASTLPTPYTQPAPNPRPLTISHLHLMPWMPSFPLSYPARRCRFCHPPCHPLPLRCQIVPLLPPIARNVTFAQAANRLECGVREEIAPDTKCKSGKNGNVDWRGQLCHLCPILQSATADGAVSDHPGTGSTAARFPHANMHKPRLPMCHHLT